MSNSASNERKFDDLETTHLDIKSKFCILHKLQRLYSFVIHIVFILILEINIRSNFVQISFTDKQIELDQKIGEIIDAIEKLKSVIPAKEASNSTDSELS